MRIPPPLATHLHQTHRHRTGRRFGARPRAYRCAAERRGLGIEPQIVCGCSMGTWSAPVTPSATWTPRTVIVTEYPRHLALYGHSPARTGWRRRSQSVDPESERAVLADIETLPSPPSPPISMPAADHKPKQTTGNRRCRAPRSHSGPTHAE